MRPALPIPEARDELRPARPGLAARWWRGRPQDPPWARPALAGLLAATALAYATNLGINGWANGFYAAATQAASVDWLAFLFGSSDAGNSITVDKPPASIWLMALSARAFGFSPVSMLLPQALLGVATVWLLVVLVRRWFGASAGLIAGTVLAMTPVAALMFRYNNPDALLVFLMTAATYCTLRAVERPGYRWLLLAGALVGLGFLTKQLQALLILPVLAGVYWWAAPTTVWARTRHLLAALGAVIVSAGWWVALVELWPRNARPYIGGSQTNSFLELTIGYNGLARVLGRETAVTTAPRNPLVGGDPAPWRLLNPTFAPEIAYFLLPALLFAVTAFVLLRRAPRSSPARATVSLLAGTLLVIGGVFSAMDGVIHAYYTLALAPAIAGLVGVGCVQLWRLRRERWARWVLGAAVVLSATGTTVAIVPYLLPAYRWLPFILLAIGVLVGVAMGLRLQRPEWARPLAVAGALIAGGGALGTTVTTLAVPHTGALPVAGVLGNQSRPLIPAASSERVPDGERVPSLLDLGDARAAVVSRLEADADDFTWVAAVIGSNNAATWQLATGDPVMPVGGYESYDPSPTLEQFQHYVAAREIHWWIVGGRVAARHGTESVAIDGWVRSNFSPQLVDGVLMYDLSTGPRPPRSTSQ